MSAPANPTLDELVSEGLMKAGYKAPSTDLTNRAKNKWMEEIKNDIWHLAKKPTFLQVTAHGILTKGQSRYSMPSDFSSDLSLTLLDGSKVGIAQGGSLGTITFAASDTSSESDVQGKDILITAGIGQGSLSQITAYNPTTKIATVTPNFNTAPSSGSTYMVVDTEYPLEQEEIQKKDTFGSVGLNRPRKFSPIGDEDYGEFILDCAPDKAYGARLRYYANLMKLDLNSTTISTLYLRWRNIWIQGIFAKALEWIDDDRANNELAKYRNNLSALILRETYGTDFSNLTQKVVDY